MAPSRSPSRRRGPPSGTSGPSWTSPSPPSTPCPGGSPRCATTSSYRSSRSSSEGTCSTETARTRPSERIMVLMEMWNHGRISASFLFVRCSIGLARMWRVIADAHRVMKRTADDSIALLTSSAAAAEAARPVPAGEGGTRGPPPPPGAGALRSELRGWRAALEAWAESQRAYAAALWGWARSCVKDGEDMPRLIVGWARAVESVDVEPAIRAVDAAAAEAAAVASAAKRQRGGGEEWFNEEEGKKKVCVALAAALGAIADAGGLAVFGYDELLQDSCHRRANPTLRLLAFFSFTWTARRWSCYSKPRIVFLS
ncbi:uncharacterized protein [Miscanthus floridulus]|uniref:uncharacterized protein isoform X2 n=1 Tax=Miscanthus floridulus TaxID=154761 RepID=UPI003457E15C